MKTDPRRSAPLKVLILEDNPADAKLMLHELRQAGFAPEARCVVNEADFIAALAEPPEVILADYNVPDWSGAKAPGVVQRMGLDVPVILVSGSIGEEKAAEAMRQGAVDYLLKDRLVRLGAAITHALVEKRLRQERHTLREKLQHEQQLFKAVIEKSSEGITLVGPDGLIIYGSPATERVLGRGEQEFMGRSAFTFIHPDDAGSVQADFAALLQRPGDSVTRELRCQHKDGTWRWLEVNGTNLLNDPIVCAMVINYRDITERRQAELALRESRERLREEEARFRALVEKSNEAVAVLDGEGRITYASPSSEGIIGYPPEEMMGRTSFDLVHPDDRSGAQAQLAALLQKPGGGLSLELRGLRRDGAVRWFDVTVTNLLQVPSVHGVVVNYRDVTERKEIELALQHSEKYFRALTDHSLDLVTVMEADGTVRYESPSVERIMGWKQGEMAGHSAFELVHPEDLGRVQAMFRSALPKPGISGIAEYRCRHKDGSWRVLATIASNLLAEPAVAGIVLNSRDVTEQIQAEAALRASEAQLSNAVKMAHLGAWEYDVAADCFTFNDQFYAMLRTTAEREGGYVMAARRYAERFVHPEDLAVVAEETRRALETTDPHYSRRLEHRMIYANGETGCLAVQIGVIKDEQGRTVKTYGVNQDITERKEAEAALRRSEAELRQAQRIAHVGSWHLDLATNRVIWSEELYRMYGLDPTRSPLDYPEHYKLFTPESWQRLSRAMALTRENGVPYELELEMTRADGRKGWMLARGEVQRDEQGRIVGLDGVAQDITERKEAEAALRKEQALFTALVSTIPDHIYFKDRQSRFVWINDLMARDSGLRSATEAVGKTDYDLFREEHARQAFADDQRVMEGGEPIIGLEEKETWIDGRVTWVATTKMPLRDAEGRITGLVGISRDVTQRKLLEQQFLQAQKMDAFGQLAGGVAHDFNNILGVMLMQLNLLQLEPGLSGKLVSGLAELERCAMRGAGLTRQLLMFSRRQEMETHVVDLNLLLDDASKMLRRVLGEHITFELKKSTVPLWINADTGMIEQVLMNLCINARDAMHAGGRLSIEIRMDQRVPPGSEVAKAFACLAVTDTGCGMDEATKARIFEPFFTTKPTGMGTGLGLATVYGIVQQHRGWLEVDSAPNRGTTFRVCLPLQERPVVKVDTAEAQAAAGGHESILLVEDETDLRTSVSMALQMMGYRVVEAASGPEALTKWTEAQGGFDLLITDFLMPGGLTGVQLAAQLVKAKESLKLIIMSGYIPGSRESATPWPQNSTRLNKPFEVRKLLMTVRESLEAKSAS